MAFSHKVLALCLAACGLQACGGSSGSTGSAVVTQPVNGTFTSTGIAVSAATTTDPATGTVKFSEAAPTSGPVLEFDIENDVLVAIRVDDSVVDIDLDLTDPTTQFASLPNGLAIANADMSTVAVFGFDDRRNFEFQSYGAWMDMGPGTARTVGSGSFGDATSTATLPSGGIQYRGAGTGIFQSDTGETFATSMEVSFAVNRLRMGIDFLSDKTVGVNLNTGATVDLSNLDIPLGRGIIVGDTFLIEEILFDDEFRVGFITGGFYGPEAEEAGGVFALRNGTSSHIGSFGAAR